MIVTSYIKEKTYSTFEYHITIITPLITTEIRNKIRSDFALMESQKDYEKIVRYMNGIAKDNNIILPENRLYPF